MTLLYRFLIVHSDPKKHQEIDDLLTGPPTVNAASRGTPAVDPEVGIAPPPWWHGDEDATRSSVIAATQARRR